MLITMKKDYCILCNGSGEVDIETESRKYTTKKCDHNWTKNALIERLNKAKEEKKKADAEFYKCKVAVETMEDKK